MTRTTLKPAASLALVLALLAGNIHPATVTNPPPLPTPYKGPLWNGKPPVGVEFYAFPWQNMTNIQVQTTTDLTVLPAYWVNVYSGPTDGQWHQVVLGTNTMQVPQRYFRIVYVPNPPLPPSPLPTNPVVQTTN